MRKTGIFLIIFLIINVLPKAQGVVALRFPSVVCAGEDIPVTIGFTDTNTIQLESVGSASMGHGDIIFLPDGVACGLMGCSYISAVDFECFSPGATLSSVEDIKFLRIKMEHSWIGDLYINLTCPNGQKADIIRYGGPANSSECTSSIPSSSCGWLNGNNVAEGTYFGSPEDIENQDYPCNAMVLGNQQGTGWNYCWSNNTTSGYSYASGDGITYRQRYSNQDHIDSSNVAAHSNFYHPDDSFSSLMGCPLNGEWYIEVQDGWSGDNGYLFEWELSMDESLIPLPCEPVSYVINGLTMQADQPQTAFTIPHIADLDHDSLLHVDIQILYSCDTVIDTAVDILIRHLSSTTLNVDVTENNLPFVYMEDSLSNDVTERPYSYTDHYGCDSTVLLNLNVWRNITLEFDTSICANLFPVTWRNHLFDSAETVTMRYISIHGADSVEVLAVTLLPSATVHEYVSICPGGEYRWIDGNYYSSPYTTPRYVISHPGVCDTVAFLHLSVSQQFPHADFSVAPDPVQVGDVVTLTDISGSATREWHMLDYYSTERSFSFPYPGSQDSVEVTLSVADILGCGDTIVRWIFPDKSVVWMPNVFTPDEQQNNQFRISSNDILSGTVTIYDRRGLLVTTFDMLTGFWDGRVGGTLCPQDTYVWHLVYVTKAQPQIEQVKKGTVILLR